ncbi:hypothetical protein [Streptomyces minutiscleroticus]|uniref:hypothetical protein n=1 Tax=Streptomyces minutiscleroticus TaxID=68238 RepID=UPI00167EE71F|nr:hypothetical protein [Streptomyces minutiscleroticus]
MIALGEASVDDVAAVPRREETVPHGAGVQHLLPNGPSGSFSINATNAPGAPLLFGVRIDGTEPLPT